MNMENIQHFQLGIGIKMRMNIFLPIPAIIFIPNPHLNYENTHSLVSNLIYTTHFVLFISFNFLVCHEIHLHLQNIFPFVRTFLKL